MKSQLAVKVRIALPCLTSLTFPGRWITWFTMTKNLENIQWDLLYCKVLQGITTKNPLWRQKVFLWKVRNGMRYQKKMSLCWMSGIADWLRNSSFLICSVWTMTIIISTYWQFPVVGMVLHSLQKAISGLSSPVRLWVGVLIRKSFWKMLLG